MVGSILALAPGYAQERHDPPAGAYHPGDPAHFFSPEQPQPLLAEHPLYLMLPDLSVTLDALLSSIRSTSPSMAGVAVQEETVVLPSGEKDKVYHIQKQGKLGTIEVMLAGNPLALERAYLTRDISLDGMRLVETYRVALSRLTADHATGEVRLDYFTHHDLELDGEAGESFQDITNVFPVSDENVNENLHLLYAQLLRQQWPEKQQLQEKGSQRDGDEGNPAFPYRPPKRSPAKKQDRPIPTKNARRTYG